MHRDSHLWYKWFGQFDANSDSDSNALIYYRTTVNSLLWSFYFRFSSFLHFHFKHCSISVDTDSLIHIFMILSEMEFNWVESVCDMNISFSCLIQICNVIIGYGIGIRIVEVVELGIFFSFRSLNWIFHCKKLNRVWFLLSNWWGYYLLEDTCFRQGTHTILTFRDWFDFFFWIRD